MFSGLDESRKTRQTSPSRSRTRNVSSSHCWWYITLIWIIHEEFSSPHNSTNNSGSKSQPFHLPNLKGWVLDPPCAIFLLSPQHPRAASPGWTGKMSFCQGAFDATSKGVPWLAPNHSVHFHWPSKQTNKSPQKFGSPQTKSWEFVRIWSWPVWRIVKKTDIPTE